MFRLNFPIELSGTQNFYFIFLQNLGTYSLHFAATYVLFRQEKFDPSKIRVHQKDEVAIYQSPGDSHCVVHLVIRSMRDQDLKTINTTNNLIDMAKFEILNNINLTSLKNWTGMKIFMKTNSFH